MKKLMFLALLLNLLLGNSTVYSQGQNNNYPIDEQDIVNIFRQLGIEIFKFPFKLRKGEFIDISIDVYEYGKLTKHQNNLEEILKVFNHTSISQHLSTKDTIAFHRIYFNNKGDTLAIRFVIPGISCPFYLNIEKVKELIFNARTTNVPLELEKKTELVFCYGIFDQKVLECATGIPLEKMINKFDLVIMIYGEKKSEG
jgi:hypothetical protein